MLNTEIAQLRADKLVAEMRKGNFRTKQQAIELAMQSQKELLLLPPLINADMDAFRKQQEFELEVLGLLKMMMI